MIKIRDLHIGVGEKEILKGVSLDFELGKNYLLLGKNGSGKSSLSSFLMGHPNYEYISGSVSIDSNGEEKNLLDLSADDRSKVGLFLSFQNVPEIKGIKLSEYLRVIYNTSETSKNKDFKGLSPFMFKRFIKKYLDELIIDDSFLERELNVGFSGGEKRKIEILQMKLIGPKYIILDEIDSGLDLDAFRTVSSLLKDISNDNNSFIIITHHFKILDYISVDKVFVMRSGEIVKIGGANLASEINEKGFEDLN